MSESDSSLLSRVQSSFEELAAEATELNQASDELTIPVRELDAALKGLNLGISSWVEIRVMKFEDGSSRKHLLGYAKIDGKWGVALRTIESYDDPRDDEYTQWLFSDAPRDMRAEAIDSIPALLAALKKNVTATKDQIIAKVDQARRLASAVGIVAKQSKANSGKGGK